MNVSTIVNLSYIVAAILFIFGIKMLGKADTAKRGNLLSAVGMLLAMIVTLLSKGLYPLIIVGLTMGGAVGFVAAKRILRMPELVALFNGFGGLASLLVIWRSITVPKCPIICSKVFK